VAILIAGGGIGGLTLALMLQQKGVECQVLEAAAETKPLGVGINALPHSIRELAALDLLPRLDAIGIRTRQSRSGRSHAGCTPGTMCRNSPSTAAGCRPCCGRQQPSVSVPGECAPIGGWWATSKTPTM
jgi:2-polyprenyl-6-methoxyphenol hydroxylase-like FAD-dependent oxidoreductase